MTRLRSRGTFARGAGSRGADAGALGIGAEAAVARGEVVGDDLATSAAHGAKRA
jgi:hypothetical protein